MWQLENSSYKIVSPWGIVVQSQSKLFCLSAVPVLMCTFGILNLILEKFFANTSKVVFKHVMLLISNQVSAFVEH